jgi:aminoglycoside/choline kinase family phosphotransferase
MSDLIHNVKSFLESRGLPATFEILTPDASTREYFRISYGQASAIVCAYPEPFDPAGHSYLDVTSLFRKAGLPVAEILDVDPKLAVIVQSDLGDTILRDVLLKSDEATRDSYLERAISLIARIQSSTALAYETGSIASRLAFDFEKLSWELDFFTENYFRTLKGRPLGGALETEMKAELDCVSRELAERAAVLTHRDFHAANLMLAADGELRIIDHQDARIGSTSYDLVSLLLDRVTEPPSPEWLAARRRSLIDARISVGLPEIDEAEFAHEFRLQTIQRCLKDIGTFSFQSANRGKTHFLPFIRPMFEIVRRACDNLGGFPVLTETISRELEATE